MGQATVLVYTSRFSTPQLVYSLKLLLAVGFVCIHALCEQSRNAGQSLIFISAATLAWGYWATRGPATADVDGMFERKSIVSTVTQLADCLLV